MQQSEPVNFASGAVNPDGSPESNETSSALTVVEKRKYHWYDKLAAVLAAIFCFELGLFLLVYPWISEWDPSPGAVPEWTRLLWNNPYFRGALSGLGVINLWISFVEVFRFRRFSV